MVLLSYAPWGERNIYLHFSLIYGFHVGKHSRFYGAYEIHIPWIWDSYPWIVLEVATPEYSSYPPWKLSHIHPLTSSWYF